jgi:hypothetical protein
MHGQPIDALLVATDKNAERLDVPGSGVVHQLAIAFLGHAGPRAWSLPQAEKDRDVCGG